ncbi:MAG: EAL domain-containing protein [Desulfuromonadales bacterium]
MAKDSAEPKAKIIDLREGPLKGAEQLLKDFFSLQEREKALSTYVRQKTNQLLEVIGTLPLRAEELDDETLVQVDPIGIVADSFSQVLEHLRETNETLALAHGEIQAIFDSAGAAILVVDKNRQLQAYNRKSQELFFPGRPEVIGYNLRELMCDPETHPQECIFDQVMAEKAVVEQQDFVAGGRNYHVIATPLKDNQGEIAQVILVCTDITERRRNEQALREAEARLKTILNSVQAGIMVIDPQTKQIELVNEAAANLVGARSEDMIGKVCHDFICPALQGRCPVDGGRTIDNSEQVLVTACGQHSPVLKTVIRVDIGGREKFLESFIDISARKEAEERLQKSEERYRSLYSTMHEGMALKELIYDEAGRAIDYRIVDVNPSYERILGLRRDRVLGRLGSQIYPPNAKGKPPLLEAFARVVETGQPVHLEKIYEPSDKILALSAICPSPGQVAIIFDDITERKKAQSQIERLAYYDMLTGLPNRVLLRDRLGQMIAKAGRNRLKLGVIFLDLDQFKAVNDTLGHDSGDHLLRVIAGRLSDCMRKSDTVARLGGDEFILLLDDVSNEATVGEVAKKVLDVLSQPISLGGREVFTTGSLGIALYPADGLDAETLLKNADTAMYQAKERGRNNFQFYASEMHAQALEKMLLANDLRRALERNEFFLEYQPQLCLKTGKMTGTEALLRWQHPDLGVISPSQFIPMAEETGQILPIGRWVLETACRQNKAWLDAGFSPLRMAVNLSGKQFREGGLLECIKSVLRETGLPASCLELELTESILMENAGATRHTLKALKEMGVQLAIDDFGTGYSSLNYLKHFPIDRLKIDKSFVQEIDVQPDDAAIAEAIIALAHSLRVHVVAEGVEQRSQLEFLRQRQCDEIQGFYFSHPLSASALEAMLMGSAHPGAFCFYSGQ